MALDSTTVSRLQTLKTQLESKQVQLQQQIASIQNIEDTLATASLTPRELIQAKDLLFAGLPDADGLNSDLSKVNDALSALTKLGV